MRRRLDDEMQILVGERRLEALDDGDCFIVDVRTPNINWTGAG